MKLGRPPLPQDQRRIKMTVRVRPAFKAQFLVTAKRRGLSVSEAQRQALQEWVK